LPLLETSSLGCGDGWRLGAVKDVDQYLMVLQTAADRLTPNSETRVTLRKQEDAIRELAIRAEVHSDQAIRKTAGHFQQKTSEMHAINRSFEEMRIRLVTEIDRLEELKVQLEFNHAAAQNDESLKEGKVSVDNIQTLTADAQRLASDLQNISGTPPVAGTPVDAPKPADAKKNTKAEGKFHDSLIEHVKELADALPALNLNDDPELMAAVLSVLPDSPVKKKGKTVYTRSVGRFLVSFDGNSKVTLALAKPYKGAVQVTVHGGILASASSLDINGRVNPGDRVLVGVDGVVEIEPQALVPEQGLDARAAQNQSDLEAAGHWGVPTMVFQGEPFFGQDRIDLLVWRLQQHGLARRS
jgi:hypothetical protein